MLEHDGKIVANNHFDGNMLKTIDVPNAHWLVDENRGVSSETPLTTGFYDDRWYTKPAPLFLPKGHYWVLEDAFAGACEH